MAASIPNFHVEQRAARVISIFRRSPSIPKDYHQTRLGLVGSISILCGSDSVLESSLKSDCSKVVSDSAGKTLLICRASWRNNLQAQRGPSRDTAGRL